jgi:phage tail P2-like protein
MLPSLLPPNATRLERALEAGTAQLGDVEAPIAPLWDPATMPIADLPFLAWGLSVDSWDPDWSEAMKRQAVADSIALHRVKGTRLSVETVLARFDNLLELVEWHEDAAGPSALPNTFEVRVPLVTAPGEAPGGDRSSAAFAEAIIREVTKVKPLREHFEVVQRVALTGGLAVSGTARLFNYARSDADLDFNTSPDWEFYLQTEIGEPIQSEVGTLLDTAL